MVTDKPRGTLEWFIDVSLFVTDKNVEEFRLMFKEFLSNSNIPKDDLIYQLRRSGASTSFYKAFGVHIRDFDAKIEKTQ